jgi:DNA-binding MarR family transcriptional regulator
LIRVLIMNTTKKTLMERLGTIFLTWRRCLQKGYSPHGITLKQMYLLRKLSSREYLHPSEIAEMLYCDRPTATVIIRNMVRQGWVTREPDPENRKRGRIRITSAGRTKHLELRRDKTSPERRFDPAACFTEDERVQFERLLGKLQNHVNTFAGK